MSTTETNGKFLKGITVTLGIIVSIQGLWALYTQSNRFTSDDGIQLELKIQRLEDKVDILYREHGKFEAILHSIVILHLQNDKMPGA